MHLEILMGSTPIPGACLRKKKLPYRLYNISVTLKKEEWKIATPILGHKGSVFIPMLTIDLQALEQHIGMFLENLYFLYGQIPEFGIGASLRCWCSVMALWVQVPLWSK